MSTPSMRTSFTDELRITVATMQAMKPDKVGAIGRAYALIIDGHVVDNGDGTGKVLSSDLSTYYTVNGVCTCDAATHGQRCKHREAWDLYTLVKHRFAAAMTQRARDMRPEDLTAAGAAEEVTQEGLPPAPEEDDIVDPDEDAWPDAPVPPAPAAPTPVVPEALFSLTLHGTFHGQDAMLTVRGMTASEFEAHYRAVQDVLDPAPAANPASIAGSAAKAATSQAAAAMPPSEAAAAEDWCPVHRVTMQRHEKQGDIWHSHKFNGERCWGKGVRVR